MDEGDLKFPAVTEEELRGQEIHEDGYVISLPRSLRGQIHVLNELLIGESPHKVKNLEYLFQDNQLQEEVRKSPYLQRTALNIFSG